MAKKPKKKKMAVGGAATRNYKKEYANYHAKTVQKQNRASRNAARATLKQAGVNVAGKDVAHRNGNPKDNRRKNLTIKTASQNRSYARTKTSRKRNRMA
jgi:spore germination protein GerM|tara:strand:- start:487 stop:783 length:297 start_codon:yes stop_codon:yes gene_type:complete